MLQVRHVVGDLVDAAANVAKVFDDEAVETFSHGLSLRWAICFRCVDERLLRCQTSFVQGSVLSERQLNHGNRSAAHRGAVHTARQEGHCRQGEAARHPDLGVDAARRFAYEAGDTDEELGALADAARGAADRAGAAIDDALAFIKASNMRIAAMEVKPPPRRSGFPHLFKGPRGTRAR